MTAKCNGSVLSTFIRLDDDKVNKVLRAIRRKEFFEKHRRYMIRTENFKTQLE